MMCKQSARKYPGPRGFLDFSLNEMREPEPRRSKKNLWDQGNSQATHVRIADLFLNLSVDIFSLHFFFPRTKLRISPDICYLRMTDIESIMTIFG